METRLAGRKTQIMMRTTFLSHTVNHPGLFAALLWGLTVAVGTWPAFGGNSVADPKTNAVTYEAFGAEVDGVTLLVRTSEQPT